MKKSNGTHKASAPAGWHSDTGAEEYKKEHQYYETLYYQGLMNTPAITCYRVIRSHLKNMVQQDGGETIFDAKGQDLSTVLNARANAIAFADHLMLELREAIANGYTDIQLMPDSANGFTSLAGKTIVSVYVTVLYQEPFTSVDMLDYEVLHSDEEVIYVPDETQAEFEEMREALNREAHSLKHRYGAGANVIQPMNFEDFEILITDYRRLKEKGLIQ